MPDRGAVTRGAAALAVVALAIAGCDAKVSENEPGDPTSSTVSTVSSAPFESSSTSPTATTTLTPAPKQFDHAVMQDSVHKVLIEYHQVKKLERVICPPKKPVEKGTKFFCTATIDGETMKVPITVTSDKGDYEVGGPR